MNEEKRKAQEADSLAQARIDEAEAEQKWAFDALHTTARRCEAERAKQARLLAGRRAVVAANEAKAKAALERLQQAGARGLHVRSTARRANRGLVRMQSFARAKKARAQAAVRVAEGDEAAWAR